MNDYGDSETQNEDGEERPFSDNSEDVDFDDNYEYDFDVENDTISSLDRLRKELRLAKLSTKEGDVESNRNKREVLAATIDGVPIIAESYAERKRNKTVITSPEGMKLYETLGKNSDEIPRAKGYEPVHKKYKHRGFHNPVWTARTFVHSRPGGNVAPTPVMSRTSRVMHTNEDKSKAFRRVVKKSLLKSADSKPEQRNYQEQIAGPEATVLPEDVVTNVNPSRRRKHRTRHNLESMDEKQHAARRMPVMHFNGDTSTLVYGQHQRYQGNGRLGHLNGLYKDWATTDWVKNLGMTRYYDLQDGILTIKETGLYYIYAQIYYLDEHDTNGFRIYNNQNLVAQCITMTHSTTKVIKGNTCFTATVDYLTKGDNLTLKDIEHMRYSLFEPGKSFFGLIKIGDAKAK